MAQKMAPSESFRQADEEEPLVSPGVEQLQLELAGLVVEEVADDSVIPETQLDIPQHQQYFVAEIPDEEGNFILPDSGIGFDVSQGEPAIPSDQSVNSTDRNIMRFFSLPEHVRTG